MLGYRGGSSDAAEDPILTDPDEERMDIFSPWLEPWISRPGDD